MEENIPNPISESEYEPADIICGDCDGNILQIKIPLEKPKLFSASYYIKWAYFCQKCGKQSKTFCSRK
jgi:hypothetical protein